MLWLGFPFIIIAICIFFLNEPDNNSTVPKNNPEISSGINMIDGHVTYKGVSDAWNLKFSPIENFLK